MLRLLLGLVIAATLGAIPAGCSAPANSSFQPSTLQPSTCCKETPTSAGDFLGCPYPSGKAYQSNIASERPVAQSAAYIQAVVDGGGGAAFMATMPTYEYVNMANNKTPLLRVNPLEKYIVPYSPFPWKASFYIEPLSDGHSLVLQAQNCNYYEGFETTYSPSGGLTMYDNTHINLNKPFRRPANGALSTSTGIPLGLLAVRPEELTAGVISHALGWNAVYGSLSNSKCVSPAGRVDCTDGTPYIGPPSDTPMPSGSHARLKSSFDISGFSPEAKIVATAMQTYGMYEYDTGCCNEILFTDDQYGAPTWTSADASDLAKIAPSDLEVVPPP
jgi:hypothetical protein